MPPLHFFAWSNYDLETQFHLETVLQGLCAGGASFTDLSSRRTTPLMMCANSRNPSLLSHILGIADARETLHWVDENGWSALRYAIEEENVAGMKMLMEAGAEPVVSHDGVSCLQHAKGNRAMRQSGRAVVRVLEWATRGMFGVCICQRFPCFSAHRLVLHPPLCSEMILFSVLAQRYNLKIGIHDARTATLKASSTLCSRCYCSPRRAMPARGRHATHRLA